LAGSLGVEVDKLFASGGFSRLLVVARQSRKEGVGLLGDAIGLIHGSSPVSGMVLRVEILEGGNKAIGNTMLLVKVDGTLNGLIT